MKRYKVKLHESYKNPEWDDAFITAMDGCLLDPKQKKQLDKYIKEDKEKTGYREGAGKGYDTAKAVRRFLVNEIGWKYCIADPSPIREGQFAPMWILKKDEELEVEEEAYKSLYPRYGWRKIGREDSDDASAKSDPLGYLVFTLIEDTDGTIVKKKGLDQIVDTTALAKGKVVDLTTSKTVDISKVKRYICPVDGCDREVTGRLALDSHVRIKHPDRYKELKAVWHSQKKQA